MKVHVYGNTLNIAYQYTKFLRAKGIDAEMFLDNTTPYGQDFPWWEDTFLSPSNLPSWIHYYPSRPFFLFPNKIIRRMIKDFSKCDVALVSCNGPILAMLAKIPFVFFSMGSDLNSIDVKEELLSLFKMRNSLSAKMNRLVKILTFTPLQKRAIQKVASKIIVLMGYQYNPYIRKFGLEYKTVRGRIAYDTDKYFIPVDNELFEKNKKYGLLFFMISRHAWKELYADLKGNDKFIRAFAKFVEHFNPNVKLVLFKKGNDYQASENLIRDLGLGKYVEWLEMINKDGVRAYESLPNCVVVDQFWHDEWYKRYPSDRNKAVIGFGFGSIEAAAAGRPLITVFKDEEFYEGNSPPILTAFTEDEIYDRIVQVYKMSEDERVKMGAEGREFVTKWHRWDNAIDLYIRELTLIYNETKGLKQ